MRAANYPHICTATPDPPLIDTTLALTKFARTPLATQLSPAVEVELMFAAPVGTAYCASTSLIAVCHCTRTAVGAVAKLTCQRIARPFFGKPA